MITPQEKFMRAAIDNARQSKLKGDYAIGAIISRGDEIIAHGLNRIKLDEDPTAHSEVVGIREACKQVGSRYLSRCVLYTTHEPCPMCTAAAIWARMDGIVFGATQQDMSEYAMQNPHPEWTWRTINIPTREVLAKGEPKLALVEGFMREECLELFHSS